MEPEEKKQGAAKVLNSIQNTLNNDYGIPKDHKLDPNMLVFSKKSLESFASIEQNLARALYYLDGRLDGPDHFKKIEFKNSQEAYNCLIDNILKLNGLNPNLYRKVEVNHIESNKMANINRAINYLQLVNQE